MQEGILSSERNKIRKSSELSEETDEKGTKSVYTITNDFGDVIFVGKFREPVEKDKLPVFTYKQGKYMPEITVKDPSLNGRRVKMFAGSEIKGDKVVMDNGKDVTDNFDQGARKALMFMSTP